MSDWSTTTKTAAASPRTSSATSLKDYATALRLKVDEIDVALARIDDGSYGRCDECYEPISQPRLRAQLPVFTCVSCRASV